MTKEIWKPISGYEGLYEVSNKGQIRSIPRLVHYSAGYDRINKGRVLEPVKASRNKNCDYFRVSLSKKQYRTSVSSTSHCSREFCSSKVRM